MVNRLSCTIHLLDFYFLLNITFLIANFSECYSSSSCSYWLLFVRVPGFHPWIHGVMNIPLRLTVALLSSAALVQLQPHEYNKHSDLSCLHLTTNGNCQRLIQLPWGKNMTLRGVAEDIVEKGEGRVI